MLNEFRMEEVNTVLHFANHEADALKVYRHTRYCIRGCINSYRKLLYIYTNIIILNDIIIFTFIIYNISHGLPLRNTPQC